jgi:hypothetical protein
MKKLAIASILTTMPFSAGAADLSDSYVFIKDAVEPAPPSVVGHLELSAGWWHREFSDNPEVDNRIRLEGHGRINIPLVGNWNLELEAGGAWATEENIDQDKTDINGFAHLWTDWTGLRLGAFGGADLVDNTGDVWVTTGGAEGEIDIGNNLTLGLQGSYSDADCPDCNFVYVLGWADFYPGPNTKIRIQAGWGDLVDINDPAFNFWNVSGTAEHRFAGTPISIFAKAGYESIYQQAAEIVSVAGGLRIFFDGNVLTLQEHDHQVPFEYRLPQLSYSFESF